jgi:hypothetical protein
MAKNFGKTTLMMVESLPRFIIDGADINHDIAGAQNSLIPSSFQI